MSENTAFVEIIWHGDDNSQKVCLSSIVDYDIRPVEAEQQRECYFGKSNKKWPCRIVGISGRKSLNGFYNQIFNTHMV